MSVNVHVYANKLTDQYESTQWVAGKSFNDYLAAHVPAYSSAAPALFSARLNGKPFERGAWGTPLSDGDVVQCYVEPHDPVTATLVVIAVLSAAAAIYYANQIPDTYNSTVPTGSSIYSVNAQGNQPRLMGVVPELFGRHKIYPDYLNPVRRQYENNEQWLYLMLCLSQGELEIAEDEIYIGDTAISTFTDDIDYQIFAPGADVSGHPASLNYYSSKEVGGSAGTSGLELVGSRFVKENTGTSAGQFQVRFSGSTDLTVLNSMGFAVRNYNSTGWIESSPGVYEGEYIEIYDSDLSYMNGFYRAKYDGGGFVRVNEITLQDDPYNPNYIKPDNTILYNAKYRTITPAGAGDAAGPYSATPLASTTNKFSIDFSFPQGLCILNGSGQPTTRTVKVQIKYKINNTAAWNVIEKTFTAATVDQLAYTYDFLVPDGSRPIISIVRITPPVDDISYKDKIEWVGLRSELPSATSYPGATTMAIKIRGTNTLAASAENKINLIATRKLPLLLSDGNGGFSWSSPTATRDIAPAIAHIIKSAGHTDSQIDLDELHRLDLLWQARGDEFNAVFDNESTMWEALKRVMATGFAEPSLDYGKIIPVRDEPRSVFEQMYQPDNAKPGTLKMSVSLFDADEPDGVEVEYFSADTWKSETILCTLPGEYGLKPEKARAYGITNRDKAYQFGMRRRGVLRYRRKQYSFTTEMDALNSRYKSYIAIAWDVPGYSQTGRINGVAGRTLFTSEPVEFTAGQVHHIALRKPDGSLSGPYIATAGEDEYTLQISTDLDFTPTFNGDMEPPLYMFGAGDKWCMPALVDDITPSGDDSVSVKAVNDDPRVYAYDDSTAPTEP